MRLTRRFYFDAAHCLPNYNGVCESLHGHTYRLEVTVKDEVKDDGMVLDFRILKEIVSEKVINELDHKKLNDILPNPTAETITSWIWDALKSDLPLYSIRLWEGNGKWAELNVEDM